VKIDIHPKQDSAMVWSSIFATGIGAAAGAVLGGSAGFVGSRRLRKVGARNPDARSNGPGPSPASEDASSELPPPPSSEALPLPRQPQPQAIDSSPSSPAGTARACALPAVPSESAGPASLVPEADAPANPEVAPDHSAPNHAGRQPSDAPADVPPSTSLQAHSRARIEAASDPQDAQPSSVTPADPDESVSAAAAFSTPGPEGLMILGLQVDYLREGTDTFRLLHRLQVMISGNEDKLKLLEQAVMYIDSLLGLAALIHSKRKTVEADQAMIILAAQRAHYNLETVMESLRAWDAETDESETRARYLGEFIDGVLESAAHTLEGIHRVHRASPMG